MSSSTLAAVILAIREELKRLDAVPLRYAHDPEWDAAYERAQGLRFALDRLAVLR